MQENNFEGQVNKIMEGFTVEPSEAVWQKLQPQIAKNEKNRRGLVPFAILCSLFLLGSLFMNDLAKTERNAGAMIAANNTTPVDTKTNTATTQQPAAITQPSTLNSAAQKMISFKQGVEDQHNKKPLKISQHPVQLLPQNTFTENKELVNNETVVNAEQEKSETAEDGEKLLIPADDKASTAVPGKNDVLTDIALNDSQQKKNDVVEKKKENTIKKSDQLSKVINRKWKLLLNAAVSYAATGNSYLGSKANSNYYSSSAYSNDGQTPATGGNGSGSQYPFYASTLKPGLAFAVGVTAVKPISSRTAFSAGLLYRFSSTSMSTGQTLNSTITGASDSILVGNANTYKNKYHFIELPVELQSMIGKGNKHPVYWNAGITASVLLHSNALQFQPRTGRYYTHNNLLNKMQLGVSAGLAINILDEKKPPLLVGPSLYYSLTPVAGKGLYAGTHYSFLGIRLQKQLGKK